MRSTSSQERAASVRAWLIQHGVAEDRLVSEGYGETRPIDSNDTAAGRARNRRIEVIIDGAGCSPYRLKPARRSGRATSSVTRPPPLASSPRSSPSSGSPAVSPTTPTAGD
jgi:chemotaxis protein MotB